MSVLYYWICKWYWLLKIFSHTEKILWRCIMSTYKHWNVLAELLIYSQSSITWEATGENPTPFKPRSLSWWETMIKTLTLEVKGMHNVAESQGAWAALTHRQCLSGDSRRKACTTSIFAEVSLCVYLYRAVCVCFLCAEVFEVRSEPLIRDFYKSKDPAGLAERCLLAISWITSLISKYYPKWRTLDWLVSGKQTFSLVPIVFFPEFTMSFCRTCSYSVVPSKIISNQINEL